MVVHRHLENASVSSAPQAGPTREIPVRVPLAEKASAWGRVFGSFLRDEVNVETCRPDERDYFPRHKRVIAQIRRQTTLIVFLSVALIILAPFLRPIYVHQAVPTEAGDKQKQELVALTEPNLTDQAVLSWVTASITEILTFGFGDFDQRLIAQRNRFTSGGWDSFVDVLRRRNWRDDFRANQLVLTTVPSDQPVIVAKGIDSDGDYIWTVEMPIVMTFATNNDVKRAEKHVVRLVVMRVPSQVNILGIGIKAWFMM